MKKVYKSPETKAIIIQASEVLLQGSVEMPTQDETPDGYIDDEDDVW